MLYSNKDDIKNCKEIVRSEIKNRGLDQLNGIIEIIVEDIMNITYAKGGGYSKDTLKSFAEVYFDEYMYSNLL
ncbi:hypothetical protein SAMN02745751_01246 [Dethiosulfatibacter aminovorans DSM 17477]|uniref:Uncharacterized protein n=1 Tax=Dethiosulfatibacter aminovorans DSM 17477 TaxID=1121476 RepID=A0A1M6EM48_9FIRM|nr:hypothetical protein [Dethiosulfatibacter aminovorans]SHI86577.1 hypothetical protein SAMN02745751_01246 [Dethiosulfatibacter aminovorans DSM 17477]